MDVSAIEFRYDIDAVPNRVCRFHTTTRAMDLPTNHETNDTPWAYDPFIYLSYSYCTYVSWHSVQVLYIGRYACMYVL